MSYCYDVMASAFRWHIEPLLRESGKSDLADAFSNLVEDMHSANHDVASKDGIFQGDGINKDARVSRAARELDEAMKALEGKSP